MKSLSFLLLVFLFACNKSEDKAQVQPDSLKVAAPSDTSVQDGVRLGDTSQTDRMPGAAEVPIGQLPLLHSSVLAQFHPNPEGFYRYRSLAYDSTVRTESVSFFKAKDDTTHIIRCIITDQNEQTASTLIKQMIEIKAQGHRDFDIGDNKKIRAYYTEISGLPAVHGYNPERRVATLNILCGDHRLVLFREDQARSTDRLIAIAKTMDLRRLSELLPQ
jgi:hypothetical protein